MDKDRFWLLAARYMAGETSSEEEKEFLDTVEQNAEYRVRYEALKVFWGKSQQRDSIDAQKAYDLVKSTIAFGDTQRSARSRSLKLVLLKIAAVVAIGFLMSYLAFNRISFDYKIKSFTWTEKYNKKGERSKILLSDGSSVWLNADSRLKFPEQFSDNREVYLSGEAFFDITKNPSKPFVIHLDNGDVRVLGTSFNVKSFKDDANVETSVVSGKVAFISNSDSKHDTIFLTPNHKAVLTKRSGEIMTQETNMEEDRAWVDGKIIFRSNSFKEVGKVLERYFDKKVEFDSPELMNCKLTGTFQNNTLAEIMELLAATKDYQYTINEKNIYISGTGCDAELN